MRRPILLSFTMAAAAGFILTAALLPLRNRSAIPDSGAALASDPAITLALPAKSSMIEGLGGLSALIVKDDHHATRANLWEALNGMDDAAVGKLARKLSLMPRGDHSLESAAQAVWERWVELAPEAAGAFLPSITNEQVKIYAGYSLIHRFALTDTERVERLITSMSNGFFFNPSNMKENLLYRIAQEHPAEAARKLGDAFYKEVSSGLEVARLWAERDPAAALEWVRTLPPDRGRNAALSAVLRAQVIKDPAAALEMVNSAPEDQKASLSAALAEGWMKADDAGALAWVRSLGDPARRRQAWEGYLRGKTREDSAAAMEILKTLPEADRETMRYRVLETLQDSLSPRMYDVGNLFDPLDLLRDAPPGAMLEVDRVMKIIASLDGRDLALNWALSLGRDDAALAAAAGIVSHFSENNLATAAEKIGALGNPDRRLPLQEKLAARWASTDFPAAEAWMRTLPPEDQGNVREVMIQTGKPEMAAPLLFESFQENPAAADDPAWKGSISSLYSRWGWLDGPAAAASALTIPPGENRTEALRQVKGRWIQRDTPAAQEWLRTLPPADRAVLENQP